MQWQFLLGTFAMGVVCHYCAIIDNFCLASLQWLNQTKQTEKKKKNKIAHPKAEVVAESWVLSFCFCFLFFCFFGVLVSCFFGILVSCFWFVVGGLKGWQNNTKVKDLGLTLCQLSHFRGCKRAFGWFYCLRWTCGSISKPCKKLLKNAGITGGSLGGLEDRLGNFVCSCKFSKSVFNKCKNIGRQ